LPSISSIAYLTRKSRLTRRANQGHLDIIAKIIELAPEPAAGFLTSEGQELKKRFCFAEICPTHLHQI
jgi:hypothetical protein